MSSRTAYPRSSRPRRPLREAATTSGAGLEWAAYVTSASLEEGSALGTTGPSPPRRSCAEDPCDAHVTQQTRQKVFV